MTESFKVPDEPGVFWCARHSKTKTRLRCGKCEAPICPKCTVMSPVGARCRDCASNRSSHIYQIAPAQYAAAFGIAFGLSWLASFVSVLSLLIWFTIFYAPLIGTLIGKAVLRVVKGKRGTKLAVVVSAGVVIGTLLPISALWGGSAIYAGLLNPFAWLFLAFAVPGAWWWIK